MADLAKPVPLPTPQACAKCTEWIHSSGVSTYSNTGPVAYDINGAQAGSPRTAAAALRMLAQGMTIRDQAGQELEFLAVTIVAGTLLCGRHTYAAFNPPHPVRTGWEALRGR